MARQIELTEGAKTDIRRLQADHRVEILDAIERILADRADVEEGHKKWLGTLGTWQMTVGEHRVWYDVSDEIVTITVVFYKGRLPTSEAVARRRKP